MAIVNRDIGSDGYGNLGNDFVKALSPAGEPAIQVLYFGLMEDALAAVRRGDGTMRNNSCCVSVSMFVFFVCFSVV